MKKYKFIEKYSSYINSYCKDNFTIDSLKEMWSKHGRFYHNLDHLEYILKRLDLKFESGKISDYDFDILVMSAFFHDIICEPGSVKSESDSVEFLKNIIHDKYRKDKFTERISSIIMSTSLHDKNKLKEGSTEEIFWLIDNEILINSSLSELIEYENKIFLEYQRYDYNRYLNGRLLFLQKWVTCNSNWISNECIIKLDSLGVYIKNRKPTIAIFPGSFNPFHIGHENILKKAEKMFDKVIIAVGSNPGKQSLPSNRIEKIKKQLEYREIEGFSGFLSDYVESKSNSCNIIMIRGLRNTDDFNYNELQLQYLRELGDYNFNSVYIASDKKFQHISSSNIKRLKTIESIDKNKIDYYTEMFKQK